MWLGRKQDPARWRERLGHYSTPLPATPIWLHAASLGEAKAAILLIDTLRAQGYQGPFVVTTTTATGAATIRPALGEADRHLYAPYDSPGAVRRALDAIRPRLLLVMEVEIWPQLWSQAQARGVPIVLANGRLSESSLNRYQRQLPALWRETLQRAQLILAQSPAIAERYQRLGVSPSRLRVSGNVKYTLTLDANTRDQGEALRRHLGTDRPVWLAASTHDGEEQIALECQRRILGHHDQALLVIVPRHPQRFAAVAELCERSGFAWQQRSRDDTPVAEKTQVYLADTLGELLAFYTAADLAWVAGSFSTVGGHNILEPAACDCPMVVGPDMRNFDDILQRFLEAEALQQVDTPEALQQSLDALLADAGARQHMARQARQCQEQLQGAAADQAALILGQLPQP
nr:3-deoxy-D-manno-octulosonic acid transferase [Motiliproteus sp. SC1-56]